MISPVPSRGSVLLIFLDGVGIGTRDPARNPFFNFQPQFLTEILGGWPSLRSRHIESPAASCFPLDATLGIAGLPQSGTGQSTLYTGLNTARMIGQHFGPYLYSTLKPYVAASNFFQQLVDVGVSRESIALANAFPQRFFDYLSGTRRRMVAGMYAALSSGIPFRDIEGMKRGEAVSTDITGERWKDIGHPDAPVITAYEAGRRLAHIARLHRFTLFEYFMTDKAGHDRSRAFAAYVISQTDEFLRGVYDHADHRDSVTVVTSDHGNLEELSTKSHTRNPVPLIAFGQRRRDLTDHLSSISEVTPAIVRFLRA